MNINVDFIYPVGSIYINLNPVDPSVLFGGTWEPITGRYLFASGALTKNNWTGLGQISDWEIENLKFSPGLTFGELRHTLTVDEMPSHSHPVTIHGQGGNQGLEGLQAAVVYRTDMRDSLYGAYAGYTGGGQEHNNMPPSLAVYMWKRIA